MVIDNTQCNGSEHRLEDCPHKGLGNHNCERDEHSEDAAVICFSGEQSVDIRNLSCTNIQGAAERQNLCSSIELNIFSDEDILRDVEDGGSSSQEPEKCGNSRSLSEPSQACVHRYIVRPH